MTEYYLTHLQTGNGVFELLSRFKATLGVWHQRSRERRLLAQMQWRRGADYGAPLAAIEREIGKPFWQA